MNEGRVLGRVPGRSLSHSWLGSAMYGGGMASVFVGQRVLGNGGVAWLLTGIGVAVVISAVIARAISARKARGGDRTGQRALLLLLSTGGVALLAYLLTSDLLMVAWGTSLQRRIPALHSALETLWPALWLVGTLPVVFVELAYASMRRAPVFEKGRLATSFMSGLSVALALVFAFAMVYAGRVSDIRFDVAFFRTAKAGDSTRRIVESLDQTVVITTFFPPTNDVAAEVDTYFGGLQKLSPFLKLHRYDHALDPAKGRELGVLGNGVVVFTRGTLRRQIALPLELERARADLRQLDVQVNNTLLNITRPPRRVYFTQGHGERVFTSVDATDRRSTLSRLKQTLSDQGYDVVELSIAHGLGADVPEDAAVLVAMGPQRAFLAEEAAALHRYIRQRGGSLLVALDPESGEAHEELLKPLGLAFNPTMLANDLAHWRRSGQASDRTNVATASYGAHISVATLAKLGMQAPVVFMGVGGLQAIEGAQPMPEVTMQADGNTWADVDGNLEAGVDEPRKAFAVAASVSLDVSATSMQGRAFVLGDADAFADIAMQNNGNQTLFADAMHWLARDEAIAGQVSSEQDVAIAHSRQKDMIWFYVTSFIPPVFILLLGLLFTRKRRAEHARDEHAVRDEAGSSKVSVIDSPAAKEATS